jgi:hypothetical protein
LALALGIMVGGKSVEMIVASNSMAETLAVVEDFGLGFSNC